MYTYSICTCICSILFYLQAIERFTQPGSNDIYTVVNKAAPGVGGKFKMAPQDQSPPAPRVREGKVDPPYVNQSSIPTNSTSNKSIIYRKSLVIHCLIVDHLLCSCLFSPYKYVGTKLPPSPQTPQTSSISWPPPPCEGHSVTAPTSDRCGL